MDQNTQLNNWIKKVKFHVFAAHENKHFILSSCGHSLPKLKNVAVAGYKLNYCLATVYKHTVKELKLSHKQKASRGGVGRKM
jgi:hypothetical protein